MISGWESLAESLTAAFGEGFVEDFKRTLQDERRAKEELLLGEQRKIAAASERLEQCAIDGIGERYMSLEPGVFWHWIAKEGRQCWNDPTFRREFLRDNPEVRVRTRPRKTSVVRP